MHRTTLQASPQRSIDARDAEQITRLRRNLQ